MWPLCWEAMVVVIGMNRLASRPGEAVWAGLALLACARANGKAAFITRMSVIPMVDDLGCHPTNAPKGLPSRVAG